MQSSAKDPEETPRPSTDATNQPNHHHHRHIVTSSGNGEKHVDLPESAKAITLLAVCFKEAALDSPTFRASMNHVNEQLESFDRWLESFAKALNRLSQEMDEIANYLISRFVPDFVTQGLIDHDYAMLVLRRYAEATRNFWAQLIKKVKTQAYKTVGPISAFQKNEMRSYKQCRRNFDAAQTKYDSLLQRYLSASKNKEASALREDAFQMAEARRAYIKASYDLSCIVPSIERHINVLLIETLADPWIIRTKGLVVGDPSYFQIGVDMFRMRSWSRAVGQGLGAIESEMLRLRQEMEQALIARYTPSRDLGDYIPSSANVAHFADKVTKESPTEKHGWLFVKTVAKPSGGSSSNRQPWVRRWAFVKDGMFGWLMLSLSKTFVQESTKIGVLLCNVSPEPNEDRRFCFEVRTKDTVMVLQAESLAELKSWLQVFEASKRKVIESSSSSEFAFQELHPLVPEFASSSGLSPTADDFLVQQGSSTVSSSRRSTDTRGGPSSPIASAASAALSPAIAGITTGINTIANIGGHISSGAGNLKGPGCLSTTNAGQLQAQMNAGKSAILTSMTEAAANGQFSSLGGCQASMSPLTLINTPMPTSMTKEALLTNAFIGYTTVPSAITANYWGTCNWAVDQVRLRCSNADSSGLGDEVVVFPKLLEPYPSYYPIYLQSQDAQMRAIFQNLVRENDEMNRVVMVFRALARPNPKQELPCKVFVTPHNVYLYSCTFGFTIAAQYSISEIVSVEGSASTGWDSIHLVTVQGSTFSMRIFIDCGRVIRRRIQFLMDNVNSETPLGLKPILEKLEQIGAERQRKFDEIVKLNLSDEDLVDDGQDRGGSLSDNDESSINTSSGNVTDATLHDSDEEYGTTNKHLLQKYLTTPLSKKGNKKITQNSASAFGTVMDKLMAEQEFDIPPKALFHVMFGEESPVFLFSHSSTYKRDNLEITPWVPISHHRMEREISYNVTSSSFSGHYSSYNERNINLQRVERRDDNELYVVYDRRSPWELPYGAVFYVAIRFIITSVGRSKSKLSIWASVEWIRSSKIARNVIETLVYRQLQVEATSIVERTISARKKLGSRPTIVNAIKIFGRLGRPESEGANGTNKENESEVSSGNLKPISLSHKDILNGSAAMVLSFVIDLISSICLFVTSISRRIYRGISTNKVLVLCLLLSLSFNVALFSKTAVQFWADRKATNIVQRLNIVPNPSTIMRRSIYLQDVTDLVNDGRGLASKPEGYCFDKFKSIAQFAPYDTQAVDMDLTDFDLATDWLEIDDYTKEFSRRLHQARTDIAIQRNDLLVSLRVLNRIEEELLLKEWKNWVLRELQLCSLAAKVDPKQINEYCRSCSYEWQQLNNHSVTAGSLL